jgi:stress-induced morphogen
VLTASALTAKHAARMENVVKVMLAADLHALALRLLPRNALTVSVLIANALTAKHAARMENVVKVMLAADLHALALRLLP